jgi:hypothetical protein
MAIDKECQLINHTGYKFMDYLNRAHQTFNGLVLIDHLPEHTELCQLELSAELSRATAASVSLRLV